jgi:SAM-dependent methyltransferase
VTALFGQVADSYDDVRPGYPAAITGAIAAYAGAVDTVVELGSGTGKGTKILAGLGAPITCIEPDPRMAALLQAKFPHATVTVSPFEQWTPPPGGVDLLGCAMAWHWLDPHTRNRHAHDALRPGGTLALFGHSYGFADSSHERAVTDALAACGVVGQIRPQQWLHDDIVASGLWSQVRQEMFTRDLDYTTEQYLQLHRTFSEQLRRPEAQQEMILAALREAVDSLGGVIHMRLPAPLVLARRMAVSCATPGDTGVVKARPSLHQLPDAEMDAV